ncbi:Major structural subunit of bundle-forming pilus precursor [compost metagenome]
MTISYDNIQQNNKNKSQIIITEVIMNNKSFKNQVGATLLELVMSIGIIAVIAIAAISFFNTANDANKVNDEVKNLNTLSAAVRNMFNSQGDYAGLTNAVIIKSGAFPDRMRVPSSATLIKHSWLNDGVVVAPATVNGTTNDGFTVTYKDVPERACSDIATKTFRFYDKVVVGSTTITGSASATTACSTAANDMVFTAR